MIIIIMNTSKQRMRSLIIMLNERVLVTDTENFLLAQYLGEIRPYLKNP